jgi:hypothetical protein
MTSLFEELWVFASVRTQYHPAFFFNHHTKTGV